VQAGVLLPPVQAIDNVLLPPVGNQLQLESVKENPGTGVVDKDRAETGHPNVLHEVG
jgi:hypothetical protein